MANSGISKLNARMENQVGKKMEHEMDIGAVQSVVYKLQG